MADKLSIVRMIGSSAHSAEDRECDDFYATDPVALDRLLACLERDRVTLHTNIWECACGDGSLSKRLSEHRYRVFPTDLVQRDNASVKLIDFCDEPWMHLDKDYWNGDILTNPPYKHASKFVENSLKCLPENHLSIMFLRLQFLESKSRLELFKKCPPRFIYVHSSRVSTRKNNDPKYAKRSSAVCFAWFVWQKGFSGEPTIRWIP